MVVGYLLVLAVLALIFLILIYKHYRKTVVEGRPESLAFVRIALSWLLLIVFVGSLGGAAYATVRGHSSSSQAADNSSSSSSESVVSSSSSSTTKLAKLGFSFSPKKPVLSDGSVKVKFKVSPKTKLTIKGHYSGDLYKSFKANKDTKQENFKYTFSTGGTYDVIATRNGKSVTKQIVVSDSDESSSSSSSVVYSSSSSEESSSTYTPASSSSATGSTGGTTSSTRRSYYSPSSTTRSGSTGGSTSTNESTKSTANTTDTGTDNNTESGVGEYQNGQ
ncbi:hypothetical protein FD16_GL001190 [Paucilactobacillus suebicus DSM 5007 = KCTC 3549]|uniref:Uncharacterized protein n=1 Tax=Paucilactobacillus suebicus DSM 5007 = KCTC 3549 TaxID=1423807 RepID=A0A0R1VXS4_9LACO|nr:hypothetical protein [Paucilactobacillus suebicus]KRM10488.1 hypothetical protein FD16_GL001190 [Paucilactobacillus suebicus DSM 5007 = KCTC 3549]